MPVEPQKSDDTSTVEIATKDLTDEELAEKKRKRDKERERDQEQAASEAQEQKQAASQIAYKTFLRAFQEDNALNDEGMALFTQQLALLRQAFKSNLYFPRDKDGIATSPNSVANQAFKAFTLTKATDGSPTLVTTNAQLLAEADRVRLVPHIVDGKRKKLEDSDIRALVLAARMNKDMTNGTALVIKGGTLSDRHRIMKEIKRQNAQAHPDETLNIKPGMITNMLNSTTNMIYVAGSNAIKNRKATGPDNSENSETPENTQAPEEKAVSEEDMLNFWNETQTDEQKAKPSEPSDEKSSTQKPSATLQFSDEDLEEDVQQDISEAIRKEAGETLSAEDVAKHWNNLDQTGKINLLEKVQEAKTQRAASFQAEESKAQENLAQAQTSKETLEKERTEAIYQTAKSAVQTNKRADLSINDLIPADIHHLAGKDLGWKKYNEKQCEEILSRLKQDAKNDAIARSTYKTDATTGKAANVSMDFAAIKDAPLSEALSTHKSFMSANFESVSDYLKQAPLSNSLEIKATDITAKLVEVVTVEAKAGDLNNGTTFSFNTSAADLPADHKQPASTKDKDVMVAEEMPHDPQAHSQKTMQAFIEKRRHARLGTKPASRQGPTIDHI